MKKENPFEQLEQEQKKHREQMQRKRDAIRARKARTRRLIIRGAIAESVIENAAQMTDLEFEQALYQAIKKAGAATSPPQEPRGSAPRESARYRRESGDI